MAHLPQIPASYRTARDTYPHKYLPQDSTWKIEANFLYPGGNSLGSPNLLTRLVNIAQANQMKGKLHCRTPQRWRNGSAECWAGDALHLRFCRVAEFPCWAKNEIRGLQETMMSARYGLEARRRILKNNRSALRLIIKRWWSLGRRQTVVAVSTVTFDTHAWMAGDLSCVQAHSTETKWCRPS